ncbi:MAG: FAD-dependent oxidoreductase [Candidatus Competibacteraceae bacterium]|nr:FAD-dependent oxidoreductase [Candidatus Competibacteraceae bacterium]
MASPDLIVGGGILGLSIAYHYSRFGQSAADRRDRDAAAAWRTVMGDSVKPMVGSTVDSCSGSTDGATGP